MASAVPELPVLARDQAFEALYRRYVKDVYHYALALLRNPADAEDVTQTTFMNAYRAYQRGDEIRKPQNWLIKIAHNVARTRYARASRRVKEVPLEDHVEQLSVPEEDRPDVVGVLRALGLLPFNQRAALVMRELEGRSYAEIAETLNVSVPAVETLIFRARRSLRLKASALRVLSAVPLPGSLCQLFEGGAVVAGGGAIVGTGFLVKAAVALVAGALATGFSGDRTGPATAASGSGGPAAVPVGGNGLMVRALRTPGLRALQKADRKGVRPGRARSVKSSRRAAHVVAGTATRTSQPVATSAHPAGSSTRSTPTTTTSQATAAVGELVGSVQDTASSAAAALPVQVPTLPAVTLPVQPPPPPPLPKLP